MFEKTQLGVFDWILLHILMAIPLVNIVIIIVLLAGVNTNETLKNYIWSFIVMFVFVLILWFTVFSALLGQFL
ncbi:MAG: hypothetical protein A2102_01240 [Tenericutes bacterium GWF2_38_8]|nr:MAG: hypothetical protein A2102_01240 [Tenericutes bacterium GWF2_38_8]HCB66677.1 hypothetical protein [Acholeplasmataceae bacterium]